MAVLAQCTKVLYHRYRDADVVPTVVLQPFVDQRKWRWKCFTTKTLTKMCSKNLDMRLPSWGTNHHLIATFSATSLTAFLQQDLPSKHLALHGGLHPTWQTDDRDRVDEKQSRKYTLGSYHQTHAHTTTQDGKRRSIGHELVTLQQSGHHTPRCEMH